MYMTSDYEGCSCVSGPAGTCPSCRRYENAWRDDETNLTRDLFKSNEPIFTDMDIACSHLVVGLPAQLYPEAEPSTKQIKARWIEATTENSVLIMTKKQKWHWIPLSVISDLKRTSKGNWKIEVYDFYKEKEVNVKTHHYFDRDEYL